MAGHPAGRPGGRAGGGRAGPAALTRGGAGGNAGPASPHRMSTGRAGSAAVAHHPTGEVFKNCVTVKAGGVEVIRARSRRRGDARATASACSTPTTLAAAFFEDFACIAPRGKSSAHGEIGSLEREILEGWEREMLQKSGA